MPSGPRGSELTASVSSIATVQTISVVLRTFDTLTDPCNYLLTQLSDRIRAEVSAPSSAVLVCSLVSVSMMSDARREYRWTVTASWTV
jgi:hypothetical protein